MSQDGPLIDLVSRGAQDIKILSNEKEKSLFNEKVNQHTNFSRGSISVDYKGHGKWGSTVNFKIPKDGDLLGSLYLNLKVPKISTDDILNKDPGETYKVKWADFLGYAIIDKVELLIGGQTIVDLYGIYQQIHTDLYDDDWNKLMMLGHDEYMNLPQDEIEAEELFIPLKFWFSDDPSKALPLIALGHHDVEIRIKFREFDQCYSVLRKLNSKATYVYTTKKLEHKNFEKISLEANMIYLDGPERKRIATMEHEILITQVQRRQIGVRSDDIIDIDFNHPVKELIYFLQPDKHIEQGEVFNFGSKLKYLSSDYENIYDYDIADYALLPSYHLLDQARIMFNGKERVSWKNYKYYYYLQNYEHFRNSAEHYVYIYSFSMNPLSIHPTGSCNFSRIDNAQIQFKLRKVPEKNFTIEDTAVSTKNIIVNGSIKSDNAGMLTVYATNYNYLIIKGGLAGVKFEN